MNKFFTLIFLSSSVVVCQAQEIAGAATPQSDSLKIAATPIPADSTLAAVAPEIADSLKTIVASFKTDTTAAPLTDSVKVPAVAAKADDTKTVVAASEAKQEPAAVPFKPEVFRKNIVKMNVSSLMFSNYNFSYERSLTRKITFTAGYRFMPKKALGQVPVFKKAIELAGESVEGEDGGDFDIQTEMNNIMMSNNALTGEFRFYTGKHAGARGFYVSLYGRYTTMRFDYDYEYEGDKTYDMQIKSTFNGYGGGVMFGAQWLIAKRVTLDWHIIGAHYGKMSGTANGLADLSEMPQDERRDLEEEIESILEVGDKRYLEATVTDKGIDAKVDSPFAGIRSGISIGIAF